MSKTIDFSVTIKNIPAKEYNDVWKQAIEYSQKVFGELLVPSDNIKLDFNELMETIPEAFDQILSSAMAAHQRSTAVKIVSD